MADKNIAAAAGAIEDKAIAEAEAAKAATSAATAEGAQVIAAAASASVATAEVAAAQANQTAAAVATQAAEKIEEVEDKWAMLGTQMASLQAYQTEAEARTISLIKSETEPLKQGISKMMEGLSLLTQPKPPSGVDPTAQNQGAGAGGQEKKEPPKKKHRII